MVIDQIENAHLYYGLGKNIEEALVFLQNADLLMIEAGKYEINGDVIFALVQTYQTKPQNEGQWEAHKKYIDIQYIVEGKEMIGYSNTGSLSIIKEYDPDDDYLRLEGDGNMLTCKPGTFAIFMPDDAHMPGVTTGIPQHVKKAVVKIELS